MKKMFDETLSIILKEIAQDHDLNEEEMRSKYMNDERFGFPAVKPRSKAKTKAATGPRRKKNAESEADMYIELEQIEIDGESYLLNSSKNGGNKVYTFDEVNPRLIGILLANGEIKRNESSSS